jgi:hypothetical protein
MNPNQELKMTISLLKNKVEEQEKTIQFLTAKMEGVSDLLYQFVGGLFSQRTQSSIINMHLNCLYSAEIQQGEREKLELEEKEINICWPTTRQGDSNEKRINALEAQFKALTDFGPIEKVFEEEDDFCESDHEDMREDYEAELAEYEAELRAEYEEQLRAEAKEEDEEDEEDSALLSLKHMRSHFAIYSDSEDSSSTHSSMPGLVDSDDLSSVSSSDIRVRISSELCGNE